MDPGDGNDRATAAEGAARRELQEETGYSGGRIERLLAVHPNPSSQTNTAHCFLATGLIRRALPQPSGPGEAQEVAEQDLLGVLDGLRAGAATMHAIHVTALWSAAARIASDFSGRFGALPARLRYVLQAAHDVPAPRPTPTTPKELLADKPPAPRSMEL